PEGDPQAEDFANADLPNEVQLKSKPKPKPKAKPAAKPAPQPAQAMSTHPAHGDPAYHSGHGPSLPGTGEPSPPGGGAMTNGNERLSADALDVVAPPVLPLPVRQLRRQPYEHELQAQVDFNRIEAAFLAGQRGLTDAWLSGIRPRQVTAVGDAIRSTSPSNTAELGKVAVPVLGEDVLFGSMVLAAQDA